jgi:hypothetical protein
VDQSKTFPAYGPAPGHVSTGNGLFYLDANLLVPPGTEGTVLSVDAGGTVHVQWDNGRQLGLVPDADEWEVID